MSRMEGLEGNANPETRGAVPKRGDLRLEGNVVGLVLLAGELPDEHRGGADQGRLAEDQPAARHSVMVQRRLVVRLDLVVGVGAVRGEDAAEAVLQTGILDPVEGLVRVVV